MLLSVPATSANLGPGFDCLGLALGLYNCFCITPARLSSIHISGEGAERVRLRTNNAFVKIFNEILALSGYKEEHFKFTFNNEIPISRGLGSSSAVIIGAICSAYHIMQKPIDKAEILNLALKYENHPDNLSPALYGGFCVSMLESKPKGVKKSTQKRAIALHSSISNDIRAVVVIPSFNISTKHSRAALPKQYSNTDAVFNLSHASMLTAAFLSKKWELLRLASEDKFHQEARMKKFPLLFGVQKKALECGALMSVLSGSGSSFLNICYADDSKNLTKALQAQFYKCRVLDLGFDNLGANVRES